MTEQELLDRLDLRAGAAAVALRSAAAAEPVPPFVVPGAADASGRPGSPGEDATVVALPPIGERPVRPRWTRPLLVAAAVLVVVAVAAALVIRRHDDATGPAVVSGDGPRPFVIDDLPAGWELAGASSIQTSRADGDRGTSVALYGPAGGGVRLAATTFAASDETGLPGAETVDVGGRSGRLAVDGEAATIQVRRGERVLVLFGTRLARADLLRMAAAAEVGGDDATVPDEALPNGWRLDRVDPAGLKRLLGMTGGFLFPPAHFTSYTGGGDRSLTVVSNGRSPRDLDLSRLLFAEARNVEVRGHRAWLGRLATGAFGSDQPTTWVIDWQERPGEMLQVSGSAVGADEFVRLLDGLRPATDAEWQRLVERTELGEVSEDSGRGREVEVGRGRFPSGRRWRLVVHPDAESSVEDPDLYVTRGGGEADDTSTSFLSGDGSSTSIGVNVLREGDRSYAFGLVGPDVASLQVRLAGRLVGEPEIVAGGGRRGWAVELPSGTAEDAMVAVTGRTADGRALGPIGADGSDGSGTATTVPAAAPTTAGG